jgi:acyl-coenzyme A synthetase/AMP-(fatty) acid ligase
MIGYWNEPIATAGALVNGWFHTGDLVSQDPDGHVWFRGRKKDIIVRGGRKRLIAGGQGDLLPTCWRREAGGVGAIDPIHGERVTSGCHRGDAGRV